MGSSAEEVAEADEDFRRKKEVVESVSVGGEVPVPGMEEDRRRRREVMVWFVWFVLVYGGDVCWRFE